MSKYNDLEVNRCYYIMDINDPIQYIYLYSFSDAAKDVFASCIYLKAVKLSGDTSVSFVTAKSRMKPITKSISIPKMERWSY